MLIVPLVFFLMGLSRLVLARDHGLDLLPTWLAAAILFGALALWRGPKLLAVGWARGVVALPGSAGPLIRNLTVFSLQYGVAVATAMKLEPQSTVAIIGHSAGYFSGWAATLLRRYRSFDRGENTETANPT